MRESVIAFCAVTAGMMLMGAIPASSGAQAISLASGFKTAIHQATATQEAHYICRRGLQGRRCYYVSHPDRNLRYDRPYANGAYPYYQRMPWDYWAAPNKN